MSARDKLRNCFPVLPTGNSNDLIEQAVDEILNDHAHELAEKIRRDIGPVKDASDNFVKGAAYGADLIDPEVKD